ncbi:ThiF domain-containing protein [Opitutaceae bacterium TAV5]|nr:ThiF domain-containing protein [Opitutaceae bacterium TAV5]
MHPSDDYLDRFGALGRLFGREALVRLRAAHACVVGTGGVGSWTAEALARSGVGAITLIDLDDVCITNVNRQLPALDGQIGRPKVAALADRIRLIHPGCRVTAVTEFFTAANADALLSPPPPPAPGFSVVVDAIDNVGNKALLVAECVRRGLPCVTTGGAGGKRDATRLRTGDLGHTGGDDLLKQVRKKLRREHGFPAGERERFGVRCVWSDEKPVFPWADGTCHTDMEPGSRLRLDCASGFGTAVWVTAAFGLVAAQEAVAAIAGVPQSNTTVLFP